MPTPRVEQPSLNRYYLAPSRTTAKPGESEALEVLAHVLGTGANSRLYRTLVVEQGIALNAGAYLFRHRARLRQVRRLRLAEAGQDAARSRDRRSTRVLADVSEHGITADELDLAKNRLIADAVYAQDNQATLARWYGAALATGETVDMVRQWPEAIRAVTADAVREAARNWLDRRASVTGYLVTASG